MIKKNNQSTHVCQKFVIINKPIMQVQGNEHIYQFPWIILEHKSNWHSESSNSESSTQNLTQEYQSLVYAW